jgi:hypothetical protein
MMPTCSLTPKVFYAASILTRKAAVSPTGYNNTAIVTKTTVGENPYNFKIEGIVRNVQKSLSNKKWHSSKQIIDFTVSVVYTICLCHTDN